MPASMQELIDSLFFNLGFRRIYVFVLLWHVMVRIIQGYGFVNSNRNNLYDFFFDSESDGNLFWYAFIPTLYLLVVFFAWASWAEERGYVVATIWIVTLFIISYYSTVLFDLIISGYFHDNFWLSFFI